MFRPCRPRPLRFRFAPSVLLLRPCLSSAGVDAPVPVLRPGRASLMFGLAPALEGPSWPVRSGRHGLGGTSLPGLPRLPNFRFPDKGHRLGGCAATADAGGCPRCRFVVSECPPGSSAWHAADVPQASAHLSPARPSSHLYPVSRLPAAVARNVAGGPAGVTGPAQRRASPDFASLPCLVILPPSVAGAVGKQIRTEQPSHVRAGGIVLAEKAGSDPAPRFS